MMIRDKDELVGHEFWRASNAAFRGPDVSVKPSVGKNPQTDKEKGAI